MYGNDHPDEWDFGIRKRQYLRAKDTNMYGAYSSIANLAPAMFMLGNPASGRQQRGDNCHEGTGPMNQAANIISPSAGSVTGGVREVLRLEAFAIMAAATTAYFVSGGNPWLYAILFFTPDLSFAAYALNARLGAIVYNMVHSYISAILLAGASWLLGIDLLWQVALILAAHAGFDRSLGYGLKYASAFSHTHLGVIGKRT
ncbi:DUF4260 domain-containing protein [Rhizobium ruizarguesonis]